MESHHKGKIQSEKPRNPFAGRPDGTGCAVLHTNELCADRRFGPAENAAAKQGERQMNRKLLPGILITLLGTALILWAAADLALNLFEERTTAVVTHIRREGGERTDAAPDRYTYNISYTFTLPNGKKVDGFTKKIGGAVYLKADGTGRIAVRYFKALPYLNVLEENTPFSPKPLILAAAGVF